MKKTTKTPATVMWYGGDVITERVYKTTRGWSGAGDA